MQNSQDLNEIFKKCDNFGHIRDVSVSRIKASEMTQLNVKLHKDSKKLPECFMN